MPVIVQNERQAGGGSSPPWKISQPWPGLRAELEQPARMRAAPKRVCQAHLVSVPDLAVHPGRPRRRSPPPVEASLRALTTVVGLTNNGVEDLRSICKATSKTPVSGEMRPARRCRRRTATMSRSNEPFERGAPQPEREQEPTADRRAIMPATVWKWYKTPQLSWFRLLSRQCSGDRLHASSSHASTRQSM